MIRPALGPACLLSCWSVLTEPARTLNQYMNVSSARTTANDSLASQPYFSCGVHARGKGAGEGKEKYVW